MFGFSACLSLCKQEENITGQDKFQYISVHLEAKRTV